MESSAPPKSGARAIPIWCARGACLARSRCVSGLLVVRIWLTRVRGRCASGSPVVRARCASNSPTVRARYASDSPLVHARWASGLPAASSHGSWSLNHQTSRISLLSS